MKKRICVFLLSLFLLLSCQHLDVKKDNDTTAKSYKYYYNLLSKEIYPEIEKIASKYNTSPNIKKDELIIVNEIALFLKPYVDSKRIVINKIRPPAVHFSPVVKLEDGSFISYIILQLEVIDEIQSDKYINFGMVFFKPFILKRTYTKMGI